MNKAKADEIIDLVASDPNVSPYLAAALRKNRSEEQARADIAAKGQAAFLTVVRTASELTAKGLPPGKTVADALSRATARKEFLWRQDMDEDERIASLLRYCVGLYQGDELAGKLLASCAVWS